MNIGTFTGYLGGDAKLNRVQSSGLDVCNFSMANNIGTKDNPKTQWVECALFDKRAVALAPYLKKGVKVAVTGRITVEAYASKSTGEPRATLRVNVSEIDFMGGGEQQQGSPQPARERQAAAQPARSPDDMDDDLPF